MKKITAKIKDGKIDIKTEGYAGASCLEATRKLIENLGSIKTSEPTDEMYSSENTGTIGTSNDSQ